MKHTALILLVVLLLTACAQNQVTLTTEEKLAKADELFERGKYTRAAELYGDVYFERQSASSARA